MYVLRRESEGLAAQAAQALRLIALSERRDMINELLERGVVSAEAHGRELQQIDEQEDEIDRLAPGKEENATLTPRWRTAAYWKKWSAVAAAMLCWMALIWATFGVAVWISRGFASRREVAE